MHSFFADHLITVKGLRPATVRSYRDTIRLLLRFVADDKGPVWDHHPPPGEQDADLDHGEVLVQPCLDAGLLAQQDLPCRAVAIRPVRAHPLDHLADQLVGELLLAIGPVKPSATAAII